MSIELIDKGISTDDLEVENVEEKEIQTQNTKAKEKKEATDLEKLEAVLSVLVENKVTSIRNYGKKVKEKKLLFNKFRTKAVADDESNNNAQGLGHENKTRANSPSSTLAFSCKQGCHQSEGSRSAIPCDFNEFSRCKTSPRYPHSSMESSRQLHLLYPRQSFENYEASLFFKPSDNTCCSHGTKLEQRLNRKRLSVQRCLPKRLSTEQWLNSTTSRQTSTETATTSSGYISPTPGVGSKRHRFVASEPDAGRVSASTEPENDVDSETIIEISKFQAQKPSDEMDGFDVADKDLNEACANELDHLPVNNNSASKDNKPTCEDSCHVFLPQCASTTCLPSCRFPMVEDQGCYNVASYRHLHPSGGHYVSCCNSPTHSFQRFHYDQNYLTLAMNLEDLEFEQEEERRKRRKRKKKRRKERQARARGLMADELKSVKKAAKVLDPEDLPKRARWTIVATACLLLLMSMLLVGVTLRMAPIIDEMVRKENEEMLHSLNRQGPIRDAATASNLTKISPATNSSNRL